MDIWLPQHFLIDLHNRATLLKYLCEKTGCIRYVLIQKFPAILSHPCFLCNFFGTAGVMKNIIALAAGISAELGYGDNAKAALITRGMAEITRLGIEMGCMEQTFAGLAGIGDLIVTATSVHSRNNRCGNLIGKGIAPDEAVKQVGMVVIEGINAIPAALGIIRTIRC